MPNPVWVGDIPYIRLSIGFCYLAVIVDACSCKVVGYALCQQIDTQLTLAALKVAVRNAQPPAGCIHHTDRGSQYASEPYRRALSDFGLRGSMSAPAHPYDNAQGESFMKTLKAEEVYSAGYGTFEGVATQRPRFIEEIYNARC